jgi:large subunit ribosomal protein L20
MARVSRSVASKQKHKKVLKQAKGYFGARSRTFKVAKQAVTKSGQYAYRDRRVRKRTFRRLWIARISAACQEHDLNYSRFICGLSRAGVELDRKVLAQLAIEDSNAFLSLVEQAKANL